MDAVSLRFCSLHVGIVHSHAHSRRLVQVLLQSGEEFLQLLLLSLYQIKLTVHPVREGGGIDRGGEGGREERGGRGNRGREGGEEGKGKGGRV